MAEKIFYGLPFRVEKLVKPDIDQQPPKLTKLDKVDLANSVRQNLRLLLLTPPLHFRFDPTYGCKVHWSHFSLDARAIPEDSPQENKFKIKIEQNLKALIERFETRIKVESVIVSIEKKRVRKRQLLGKTQVENNILQITVKLKARVKEEYVYDGQPLIFEDAIPLL